MTQPDFPNIVCFCPDPMSGKCYDIENLLDDSVNPNHEVAKEVSALALWRNKRILCLYENPHGKKLIIDSCRLRRFFNLEP